MSQRHSESLLPLSALVLLVLVLAAGCGRVPGDVHAMSPGNDSTAARSSQAQALPFTEAQEARQGRPELVPDERTIPTGTAITIRLRQGISSASARPGDRFAAVLDEPLIIDGRTLAPKGAPVVGRVIQSRHSDLLHDSGYLRLTLASIGVDGKNIPVQASSLFAQGTAPKKRYLGFIGGGADGETLNGAPAGRTGTGQKEARFHAEQRLIFRLTQPAVAS